MSVSPTDHPDADLLADLAAEVLPREQALAVEQHVVACSRCAGLLADAEGIRRVLRDDPVGPMPADIAARLDSALQREGLWAAAQTVQTPAITEPVGQDEALTSTGTFPKESFFDEPYPTSAIPVGSIPVSSASTSSRLRRADRSGTQRTRRQVRSEERTRPGLALLTSRPVLGIAAGLVGITVLGVAVQQLGGSTGTSGGNTSAVAGSAGGAAPESAPAVPVLATGTDYTKGKLAAQAKALVGRATAERVKQDRSALAGGGTSQAAADASGGADPAASAPVPATRSSVESTAANQLLRDPAALDACLKAIDSAGTRPVAVDLATYQGREAAILVLPAAAGGYEVWAVSRTCKPGADGTLLYTTVR